jgi:Flp pilus assembly protein protease CpaA
MSTSETAAPLALLALLVIATQSDLRRHRIPNGVSLVGLIAGLALQGIGNGLPGLLLGLAGATVGLLCFAPFYLLRGMGAGDVKLLAAAGAFLGPQGALVAALFSLVAGGFAAIAYVLWHALRASATALLRDGPAAMSVSALVAVHIARRDRLAFALPIAVGCIAASWQLGGLATVVSWSLRWLS